MWGRSMRYSMMGVVLASAVAGCGGSTENALSVAMDGGESAADGSGPTDFDRLQACAGETSCSDSFAQLVESGGPSGRNMRVERVSCFFEALRERTPGKYLHLAEHHFSNGAVGARHFLVVTSQGEVKYARHRYRSISMGAGPDGSSNDVRERLFDPGRRCQLKPPSYFDDCLTALKSPEGDAAWSCAFGDGSPANEASSIFWFESCTDESPMACE
jgi:hypothetical protein